ncbi:MAG TPA: hypothetical protein VHA13_05000 [Gammaproteobacteria bacterium]|nr:hypothetical protein [Gammaproteobacteria bacterium]
MQNVDKAIGITKMLNFSYNMSLFDGGKQKHNFSVELVMRKNSNNPPSLEYKSYSDVKKMTESKENNLEVLSTNSVRIKGDLIQAFNCMAGSYISETTQSEAVEAVAVYKLQENREQGINTSNNI